MTPLLISSAKNTALDITMQIMSSASRQRRRLEDRIERRDIDHRELQHERQQHGAEQRHIGENPCWNSEACSERIAMTCHICVRVSTVKTMVCQCSLPA